MATAVVKDTGRDTSLAGSHGTLGYGLLADHGTRSVRNPQPIRESMKLRMVVIGLLAAGVIVVAQARPAYCKAAAPACKSRTALSITTGGLVWRSTITPRPPTSYIRATSFTVTGCLFRNNGARRKDDDPANCHVSLANVRGVVFTGNAFRIWQNKHMDRPWPRNGLRLEKLRECVIANNALYHSASHKPVDDLGGHRLRRSRDPFRGLLSRRDPLRLQTVRGEVSPGAPA